MRELAVAAGVAQQVSGHFLPREELATALFDHFPTPQARGSKCFGGTFCFAVCRRRSCCRFETSSRQPVPHLQLLHRPSLVCDRVVPSVEQTGCRASCLD